MDNYTADVEDILEYFDEHGDEHTEQDFEAIIDKINNIRTTRKQAEAYNEAVENIKNAIKQFYEFGGYIAYYGDEECDKDYADPYDFFDDISFYY